MKPQEQRIDRLDEYLRHILERAERMRGELKYSRAESYRHIQRLVGVVRQELAALREAAADAL